MTPDDERHGTNAGYLAHYRDNEKPCPDCNDGRYLMRKRRTLDHYRGIPMLYTAEQLVDIIAPWTRMGLTPSAISVAAGFETQRGARINEALRDGTPIRRNTYRRLAEVTEDDFAADAKIYASLTRMRIYSLMAAGHRLIDMPINPGGHWRTRTHVTVETARTIRAFYRDHEFQVGSSTSTASRAKNAGHRPPLAWDDPGTLAWPMGEPRLESDWAYTSTDRAGALRDLADMGLGITEAARRLHLSHDTLQKWCERRGMSDIYRQLAAREALRENQYAARKDGAA